MQGVNQLQIQTTWAKINGEKSPGRGGGWVGREDPAAHRLCLGMLEATYFFQRSSKGVEVDTVHLQVGERLKYFQITEFLSLLLFSQVSVMQL